MKLETSLIGFFYGVRRLYSAAVPEVSLHPIQYERVFSSSAADIPFLSAKESLINSDLRITGVDQLNF
ncbi:hypothetical protein ULF88_07750 [Halopseudomonas pachastrellae]|nr:hypothetical protein [Halopseudomonas pachastrellae]